jgi:hypothetical protein
MRTYARCRGVAPWRKSEMTITNDTRRRIMLIAWDFFREDRHEGFGRALKRAWAFVKRSHQRPDRITRQVAAGATHLQLTSLVRRADRRHLGNDLARRQAQFGR